MLRSVTDKTVKKCGQTVFQTIRRNANGVKTRKGGAGKKIFVLSSVGAGVVAGTLGYAIYDPLFRTTIEKYCPPSKELFKSIEDKKDNAFESTKVYAAELRDKVGALLPKFKRKESVTSTDEKPLLRLRQSDTLVVAEPSVKNEEPFLKLKESESDVQPKTPISLEAVDVEKPTYTYKLPESEIDMNVKKTEDYEMSLKAALVSAESRVKLASSAKLTTISAIREHARLLKEAAGNVQDADWDAVSKAAERVDAASREDLAEEYEARNYLDSVRKVIADGKMDKVTRYTPLIANAIETVNKLDEQLDELKVAVRKSRDESRRAGQFRDLINQSRKIYADELKDLLPGIDTKSKAGSALSEDELNMLVAHAHLKVTQLRQRLSEQQAREEENIAKAVEQQRIADALIAEEELKLELKRLKDQFDVEYERKLLAKRQEWEEEVEERLRNAAAAHSEHLEQVVKTQRQLYDIEQAAKIDEAVGAERRWNSEQIAEAQQKLEGIQLALNSRLAADVEHRRSKQFWIACQNLVDSVIHGRKAGLTPEERRSPLSDELKVIKESSVGDEYVQSILSAFSEEILNDGVYPEQDLKSRFAYVYKVARRVAKIDENGGGILQYLASYIQNLLTFDLPHSFSAEEKVDPDSLDTYEILSRTKYFVEHGDLTSAIRIAQLLKGEPARLARDWIHDTRAYLEARFLVELLLAHAAVLNVRTTYAVNEQ